VTDILVVDGAGAQDHDMTTQPARSNVALDARHLRPANAHHGRTTNRVAGLMLAVVLAVGPGAAATSRHGNSTPPHLCNHSLMAGRAQAVWVVGCAEPVNASD
jgi:hypothetical protein